jgi:DNA primase catalytic core
MRIENEAIDKLKREVDLVALVQSEGVKLKKRGANWVGLCPFHDEEVPSFTVNPKTNLFNCFGCDAGGNAITFVMKKRGLDFRAAYNELSSDAKTLPASKRAVKPKAPDRRTQVRRQKLLARVVAYYQRCFNEKPEAREYLAGRGISDNAGLEAYNAGFCDGTLRSIAPDDAKVVEDMKAIGILTQNGRELLEGCVVFPLLQDKQPVGLYGRRFKDESDGGVSHLYSPGARRGLIHAASAAGTVVLCESVIDALTLCCHAISAVPCWGTQGMTPEHVTLLRRSQVDAVVVAFDGDKAGQRGAEEAARLLRECGKQVRIAGLPDGEDVNSLVAAQGIEPVRELLGLHAPASPAETTTYERTDTGFVQRVADRLYEAKAISRQGTQLRVTLKATGGEGLFELATVDFYSHRSRAWFASLCAKLFVCKEEVTRGDLTRILERVESLDCERGSGVEIEIPDSERAVAERLLSSPNLMDELADDLELTGYTGERVNKLICYLTAISRKLEEPLSVLIQSRSAAGKSALQEAILALVPDEDSLHYSRLTDQALFYQREDALVHKLLAIEEAEGMGGAAYSIRAMQSAKKLTVAATGKDPVSGKMTTEEYTVRGPVAVMLTTTRTDFDQETMSRFLCLTVDESTEMTERIHRAQRHLDTLEGLLARKTACRVSSKHHNAQRLLEPLAVVNPFAPKLSFPADSLNSRRDHKKYLGIIKAIAYLHQKQRAVKEVEHEAESVRYIEATLEDIALANDLARDVLSQSLSDLTPQGQRLLDITSTMLRDKSNGQSKEFFSRRELREYSRWSDWQVRTHLAELVELEYVGVSAGHQGKQYQYRLLDGAGGAAPALGFTPTDALLERLRPAQPQPQL